MMLRRAELDEVVVRREDWTWRVRSRFAEKVSGIEKRITMGRDKPDVKVLKVTGGRRTIWTMPLKKGSSAMAFVKHYSRPDLAKQLKHLVRNSRTRQEWEMGLRLESLGLPVARHLAMGERRIAGLLQEDYLVQEHLADYKNFDAWFKEQWEDVRSGPEVKDRREVINVLAGLIRKMHDQGVLQRDFKPDSIMVGPGGDLKIVDLERVRIKKTKGGLSTSDRIMNLAKIDQTFGHIGSTTDRLRFLKHYFQKDGLSGEKLWEIGTDVSRKAERNFRKRAREYRVWSEEDNVSYTQYNIQGYRVSAFLDIHEKFLKSMIQNIDKAAAKELVCSWAPEQPDVKVPLRGMWCDAQTALGHSPYLYHRRVPFIPARAAVYPSSGPWGLLLYINPGPPLMTWKQGAENASAEGRDIEFATDLGRALSILHRMGITWSDYRNDIMLYDPTHPNPLLRFYVNRLDLLLLDRSPSLKEAAQILEKVEDLLKFSREAQRAMREAYQRCRVRWFRAPDRW